MELKISKDYSKLIGLRYCTLSDFSGEDFYHKVLNAKFKECLEKNEKLVIDLDGTRNGYSPSFLDEAFGNLVYDFGLDNVKKIIEIKATDLEYWKEDIEKEIFPTWEKRRKNEEEPKITETHPAWYRFVSGQILQNNWSSPKVEIKSAT